MNFFISAIVAVFFGTVAWSDVPQTIVDECHAAHRDSYNQISGCLIRGAVALTMISTSLRTEFYGSAAQPIIDSCQENNETTAKTWVCLRNAAEEATKIRNLIGADAMKDSCYRSISNPSILEKLEKLSIENQREHASDEAASGLFAFIFYHPFKGCPG